MTDKFSSISTPETEVLKEVYAAINRDDIPAALKFFDPQIVRVEPEGFPSSGVYRGIAAMAEHWSKARLTWAEGSCTPEGFVIAGDKIAAHVHVHVRLKNETKWIDARIADGFLFRGGKILEMHTFLEASQALAWANQR